MPVILIDTNLLVYLFDYAERHRQNQAIAVPRHLETAGSGRLSVQSLAEFASVSTRKLRPPLTPAQALQQVESFSRALPVLDLTSAIVLEATRGLRDHRLSYHDAQIWATARLNQIPVIFSEDFASGSTLEGVRFVNPIASDFALDQWAVSITLAPECGQRTSRALSSQPAASAVCACVRWTCQSSRSRSAWATRNQAATTAH